MRKLGAIAIAGTALLLLAGCSPISAGRITDKTYTEPYDVVRMQCMQYDKNNVCKMQIPVTDHYPARYVFDIEDGEETGWVNVDKYKFEAHEVGDWYEENGE